MCIILYTRLAHLMHKPPAVHLAGSKIRRGIMINQSQLYHMTVGQKKQLPALHQLTTVTCRPVHHYSSMACIKADSPASPSSSSSSCNSEDEEYEEALLKPGVTYVEPHHRSTETKPAEVGVKEERKKTLNLKVHRAYKPPRKLVRKR